MDPLSASPDMMRSRCSNAISQYLKISVVISLPTPFESHDKVVGITPPYMFTYQHRPSIICAADRPFLKTRLFFAVIGHFG